MDQDFHFLVGAGKVPGVALWSLMGYNPDVDENAEVLWAPGGLYVWPTGGMGMEVVSDSASDTSDGTGARTVKIGYLDTSYAEKTVTKTMNGTNAVALGPTDILRVNYVKVATAGSGKAAAGTINVRHLSDTPIYRQILPGHTRSRCGFWTVPAGKTLMVDAMTLAAASGASKIATFTLKSNYDQDVGSLAFMQGLWESVLQDQTIEIACRTPLPFPPQTDLWIEAQSTASANVVARCCMRGYLVG